MKTSTPPLLAVWLLAQMALGPNNDALIGDLTESLAGGQTQWWLWRQVRAAVTAKMLGDLRAIPLRAATAITCGWILVCILMYGGMLTWGGLIINVSNLQFRWSVVNQPHYQLDCYATLLLAHTVATAVVLTFDGKRRMSLALAWIAFQVCWGGAWMIYFFQDPAGRYATIQLGGFLIGLLGSLLGALLSLNWSYNCARKTAAPPN